VDGARIAEMPQRPRMMFIIIRIITSLQLSREHAQTGCYVVSAVYYK